LADAYYNRGLLYKKQGKFDLAFADFEQIIAINPNYPNAYLGLGLVYLEKEDIEAARTNLQKAQELYTAHGNTAHAEKIANILQQLP
jgi:lipoprotein NlpI